MADNFHAANMLAEYSLNLLRGQMVTQLMTGQGLVGVNGMSLTEYILGKPREKARRSGTDMMNDALTGLMRSDAGMLRQASKNMLQGKALLETGSEAIGLIREKVKRMNEIVGSYVTGDTALKTEYADLAAGIKSVIEGTQFNGIKLMDSDGWADDERITPNGSTGKLQLQAGYAQNELTLYDLKGYKTTLAAYDLDNAIDLSNATADLSVFDTMLEGMDSSYKARAGLLSTESATFERQADILDEATGRAKPGDEESLKQAIIDILMRNGGSILNGVS